MLRHGVAQAAEGAAVADPDGAAEGEAEAVPLAVAAGSFVGGAVVAGATVGAAPEEPGELHERQAEERTPPKITITRQTCMKPPQTSWTLASNAPRTKRPCDADRSFLAR